MAIRHYVYAAGIAAGLALLAACGDEVTEVTEVSEKASLDQVKKFKELPKCDEDAEGSLVYVKDSAKVFSCNGKDWVSLNGKDGSDGKNGSNGNDGTSCTVKQNKKKTGLDIVCDGKKVGSVENGSDGKNGSDGDDGASCTVKQNKKKTGFDIVCGGKTVGTVLNGDDGKTGDGCSLEDNGSGQVSVKCGGETVTLAKAFCGSGTYDPATQFCVDNKAYPKCHNLREGHDDGLNEDFTYDVNFYFCDVTDSLVDLCGGQSYDLTTQFCYLNMYPEDRCSKVAAHVDESQLENGTFGGFYFCHNGVLWNKCGGVHNGRQMYGSKYDPETQFCSSEDPGDPSGQIADLCGKKKKTYDVTDSMCVNGKVQYAKECCKPTGAGESWCEEPSHKYDVRTHFCDARDGQTYKFTKIAKENEDGEVVYSATWMAENLNYVLATAADFVSECRKKDETTCDKTYGRYYSWSTAKSSCPDGWTLPTQEQYAALFAAYDNMAYSFFATSMNTSGFSVIPGGYLKADPEDDNKVYEVAASSTGYFWSKTGLNQYNAYIGIVSEADGAIASKGQSIVDDLYLLNVRCIKKTGN